MTSAQVVETSVTNSSSFQNHHHLNDYTMWTIDWYDNQHHSIGRKNQRHWLPIDCFFDKQLIDIECYWF